MKKFLFVFLFFSGCTNPFQKIQVGDCLVLNENSYEDTLVKVVEEGRFSFRVVDGKGGYHVTTTKDLYKYEVDCFNRFNNVKEK